MYLIDINEQQRLALIKVLKGADPKLLAEEVSESSGLTPLQYWVEMLEELPTIDQQGGKLINGFCI